MVGSVEIDKSSDRRIERFHSLVIDFAWFGAEMGEKLLFNCEDLSKK